MDSFEMLESIITVQTRQSITRVFNVQRFANVPHVKPRIARLTLAFSKELPNFKAAIGFNIVYYNFVKTQGTLRRAPAMAAGVERNAWTIGDFVDAY
jgi:hypothetical protein